MLEDFEVKKLGRLNLIVGKNNSGKSTVLEALRDYAMNIEPIPIGFIPTEFIPLDDLAKIWDSIIFTEHEEIVKQAIKIIAPDFENIAFILNEDNQRAAIIKMKNIPRPISIKYLGDGMLRIFQIAIQLVSAKGGFLLIDEFENGLHYSVQEKIWTLLFEMAEKLNIQVFATTHSWDCIESFTKVAILHKETEAVLFHMGRSVRNSDKGRVIATVYDKDALTMVTQSDLDIR
jgi:AAA15 family ATPase/GTPase